MNEADAFWADHEADMRDPEYARLFLEHHLERLRLEGKAFRIVPTDIDVAVGPGSASGRPRMQAEGSGWYVAANSAYAHYVHVESGVWRVRRKAVCGRAATTWGQGDENAARRCEDCTHYLEEQKR